MEKKNYFSARECTDEMKINNRKYGIEKPPKLQNNVNNYGISKRTIGYSTCGWLAQSISLKSSLIILNHYIFVERSRKTNKKVTQKGKFIKIRITRERININEKKNLTYIRFVLSMKLRTASFVPWKISNKYFLEKKKETHTYVLNTIRLHKNLWMN